MSRLILAPRVFAARVKNASPNARPAPFLIPNKWFAAWKNGMSILINVFSIFQTIWGVLYALRSVPGRNRGGGPNYQKNY